MPQQMPAPSEPVPDVRLTLEEASRLSQLALGCIGQEYPNKPGQASA